MVKPLSAEWVEAVVEASSDCASAISGQATVAFTIGKTSRAVMRMVDGRVVGAAEGDCEPEVTVPVTGKQLSALIDGSESMALSYIRGDVKPVGSTGALLPVVALFSDRGFRQRLASALGDEAEA